MELILSQDIKHRWTCSIGCYIFGQQKRNSLGIPESVPFRDDRSRMLRESRKGNPRGGSVFRSLSMFNLNLRKRDTMEIIKGVHDLAFVLVLIATVMAPRAIGTYLAVRK